MKITLDSSCFDQKNEELLERLIRLSGKKNILLQIAPQTLNEVVAPGSKMICSSIPPTEVGGFRGAWHPECLVVHLLPEGGSFQGIQDKKQSGVQKSR